MVTANPRTEQETAVAYLLGDPDQTVFTAAVADQAVDNANREVAREFGTCIEEAIFTTTADVRTYGTTEMGFAGTPYRVLEVQRRESDTLWWPLDWKPWARVTENPTSSLSYSYSFNPYDSGTSATARLLLDPTPNEAFRIRVIAQCTPEAITTNDITSQPPEVENTIFLKAAMSLRGMEGDHEAQAAYRQLLAAEKRWALQAKSHNLAPRQQADPGWRY
jgi:hypothetical protein